MRRCLLLSGVLALSGCGGSGAQLEAGLTGPDAVVETGGRLRLR